MWTPGEWPDTESTAEKGNDYLCETLSQASLRDSIRERSRDHSHDTCAQLTQMLKHYVLPSSGRRALLLARLEAHEAALVSPPFIVVGEPLSFKFLELPNEVRNMVYKELLTLNRVSRSCTTQILRANKQIYSEA